MTHTHTQPTAGVRLAPGDSDDNDDDDAEIMRSIMRIKIFMHPARVN